MEKEKCHYTDSDGNEIDRCISCGVELSPHNFELADTCYGETYVVQILKCKECGMVSFGWHCSEE